MRQLAHLVRTDARRVRWAILLWTALVAAETAITAVRPGLMTNVRTYSDAGLILSLLWAALQIGLLLIVPLIVQADPAVGTDAFWMTRPIPQQTLFASKAVLLVALTVALPCAARLALMLSIHMPIRETLLVTLDMAISSSAWLAVVMAGAVLTRNLARFALLCGGVVVSFVLFVTIMLMRVREAAADSAVLMSVSTPPVMPPADDATQGVLFLLCVIAAGLALTALQYRTRLRRVSVPAGVGALVVAVLAIAHWPVPLLAVRSDLPAWAGAVQLRAADGVIQMDPLIGSFNGPEAQRNGRTRVVVGGLAPGWTPRLELLAAAATLADGTALPIRGRGYQSSPQIDGFDDNPDRVAARQVLGVERVLASAPPRPEWPVLLAVPSASLPAALPAAAEYHGRFAVQLLQWETVATLPLRPGAAYQDRGYRFAIEQIDTGGAGRLALRAREWRATSAFDRMPAISYAFYLRNARRTHAMAGSETQLFVDPGSLSFGLPFTVSSAGPSRFFLRAAIVSFPPSWGLQEQTIDWDPAWYADAALVIVRVTATGQVVRPLDMPHTTLRARDK